LNSVLGGDRYFLELALEEAEKAFAAQWIAFSY
jgi:hypothetical protein